MTPDNLLNLLREYFEVAEFIIYKLLALILLMKCHNLRGSVRHQHRHRRRHT